MSFSPSWPSNKATSDLPLLTLASQDIVPGCILWLGDEHETVCSYSKREEGIGSPVVNFKTKQPANPGMFGHPIVVLSRPLTNPNTIFFHQMTSFAGKTLAERCSGRKAAYRQQTFCPITPAEDHPQLHSSNGRYRTLTLEHGDALEKPSYVNVREVYQMDWRDAQPFWGADSHIRKKWRLDARSIASLSRLTMASAGFRADAQYRPTPSVQVGKETCRSSVSQPLSPVPWPTPSPSPRNPEENPAVAPSVGALQRASLPSLPIFKKPTANGNERNITREEEWIAWIKRRIWVLLDFIFRYTH